MEHLGAKGIATRSKDATKKLLGARTLLVTPGLTTSNKKLLGTRASLLGARTLLVSPGLTTSNKKLLGAKGIATRSKNASSKSWPYY